MHAEKILKSIGFGAVIMTVIFINVHAVKETNMAKWDDRLQDNEFYEWFGYNLTPKEKCYACKIIAETVLYMLEEQKTEAEMEKEVIKLCIDLKIETARICNYVVPQYKDMGFYVVQQTVFTPDQMCGMLLGPSCDTPYFPTEMWNVTLPDVPKPPVKPPKPPAPGAPKVRFLQLTDIHIDLLYEEGRDALCGEPLCCRSNDGMPAPGVPGAGRWGDYRHCDSPLGLVDDLFQHLAANSKQFDFVIFTGDITAHDIWNQTQPEQIAALERLGSYFEKYLPGKPIYFCAGNHDSAPCDSFPPPFIHGNRSIEWMYEHMAREWGKWLPPDTKETILRAGYYTMSPYPGFRIISLNDNFCYNMNWWVFINTTDPFGELKWFAETLQAAEDKGEKVFVLAHLPTSCMKAWSWNYFRIVSRYENTIVGQFNGHTHTDEFRMYYDIYNLTRPVGVAYVGGSVSPYHFKNPNYRIYTMDGFYPDSSFAVLDYEDYVFNIATSTNTSRPKWELSYSPMKEYGMKNLYPESWNDLVYRMRDDDDLFNKFHFHITKGADVKPCTHDCKFKVICRMKQGRTDDPSLCSDL